MHRAINIRRTSELRVGLVLQTGQVHMRRVSSGVFQFLRMNSHWRIEGDGHYPLLQWGQLSSWRGDGLIGIPNTQAQLEKLFSANVPVVSAGSRIIDDNMPVVACDSKEIGKMAAEHLLSCGLKNFLFVSELKWVNERLRYEAFSRTVENAGCACRLLKIPVREHTARDGTPRYHPNLDQIALSLTEIDKPVGVCAPNSGVARFVIEVATSRGFAVPDQIAVIGVNDDPLVCESTNPHISAVIQPSEQIGFEAARLLDLLMAGRGSASTRVYLPPLGIAARRSTDMLAVDDEDLRAALRYFREHAREPIEVSDVANELAVSRRTLEKKFKNLIGRTPAMELRRVRIELAKKLLAETSDPITSIVFAAGFNSRQVFSALFRRETGISPSEYRSLFKSAALA